MTKKAFQDYYPEDTSYCYGCGRLNEFGLHIRSHWDGEESVAYFDPQPYHTAGSEETIYGGLIASLIDCHSTGTAAAAAYRAAGREMGAEEPAFRFVTAALHVDYLRPTPSNTTLEVRGWVTEIKGRKIIVKSSLLANGVECVRGEVVAVRLRNEGE